MIHINHILCVESLQAKLRPRCGVVVAEHVHYDLKVVWVIKGYCCYNSLGEDLYSGEPVKVVVVNQWCSWLLCLVKISLGD